MKCLHNRSSKKIKLIKLALVVCVGTLFFIPCSIWANGSASGVSNGVASSANNRSASNVVSTTTSITSNRSDYFSKAFERRHFERGYTVRVKMLPGSVKANVERIARMYGWRTVVWESSQDYNWHGVTVIKGSSLPNVMGKILLGYPLQASFYQGNHVLVIQPRTLK